MSGHLIRRLNQKSNAVFHKHAKRAGHDMTSVQYAALYTLLHQPDLDQASLSEVIAYDRATIGEVIKRLVKKGFIERHIDTSDRRARRLRLTDAGTVAIKGMIPSVVLLQDEILDNLSEDERKQFIRLAGKAVAAADEP